MICPYNGFTPMNCAYCAAWIRMDYLVEGGQCVNVCSIAFHGGAVPTRPLLALPEVKQSNEWR